MSMAGFWRSLEGVAGWYEVSLGIGMGWRGLYPHRTFGFESGFYITEIWVGLASLGDLTGITGAIRRMTTRGTTPGANHVL